jgi:GR25 family glycosyltransferase involved in LPS biosynthesis
VLRVRHDDEVHGLAQPGQHESMAHETGRSDSRDSFAVSRWPSATGVTRETGGSGGARHEGRSRFDYHADGCMNVRSLSGVDERLRSELAYRTRRIGTTSRSTSFGLPLDTDAIGRVLVINLDRRPDRWRHVSRELDRILGRTGRPISSISRRFSAVDARYLDVESSRSDIDTDYYLTDQLTVEPEAKLSDTHLETVVIEMTPQEVAVALSHIAVWRLIAAGDVKYTLVLEDDAFFRRGFPRHFDAAWAAFLRLSDPMRPTDLLYLSYSEARTGMGRSPKAGLVRRPDRGVWQLSGYVLSKPGAEKLLAMLPARGPIDLWVNLKFPELDVRMTRRPLIDQRTRLRSSNAYSILPVFSQLGVLTREKPAVFLSRHLPRPIVAHGDPKSGLTSLAAALSMLGYRCCSDLRQLPSEEQESLLAGRRPRAFDAYVNIGSLGASELEVIARRFKSARFIQLASEDDAIDQPPEAARRTLIIPADYSDKWELLSDFLGCEYPALPYPSYEDVGQRLSVELPAARVTAGPATRLQADTSPWIVPMESWPGIRVADVGRPELLFRQQWTGRSLLVSDDWFLRHDTFPSNLVLFLPGNAEAKDDEAVLGLRKELTAVRAFTSAAIASTHRFRFGRFTAEVRPPKVSGLVTGAFLHRNGPRQEIDIELLGRDPTKLLVNVFFNPGGPGTKLEYGYRGTPTVIDLGFDASDDFHVYEIDWQPNAIRWIVDGRVVHERVIWQPTPIPDQPMEFNVNLWHSRSTELTGKLDTDGLPAQASIRSVSIGVSSGSTSDAKARPQVRRPTQRQANPDPRGVAPGRDCRQG